MATNRYRGAHREGRSRGKITLEGNVAAYRRLGFRPRVLTDVAHIDTTTTLLGRPAAMPLVLAPTGFTRIADPDGERAVARAAARAGVPYTLSTLSTCSIEEVAEANGKGERWFQVYVWRDRGLVAEMLARASSADYHALCVTVDTAVLGRRDRDHRRGFTLPPKVGLRTVWDGVTHPGWTWAFARAEPITFANVTGRDVGDGSDPVSLSEYVSNQFDAGLSWNDLEWFRNRWSGPIVLKGIQTVEDAQIAARMGIEAVAVSNHGGRQLDGAPAPLEVLEKIVDAVGAETEVICDGGVRRGADIVKAVALGAQAAMAGRAYLYGLGAAGEAGVDWALERLADDVGRTLALLGAPTIEELDTMHVAWTDAG